MQVKIEFIIEQYEQFVIETQDPLRLFQLAIIIIYLLKYFFKNKQLLIEVSYIDFNCA